jgi:hypothetical protein
MAAASVLLTVLALVLGGGTLGGVDGRARTLGPEDASQLASVLGTVAVGLILSLRRPHNPIGWIFGALALLTATFIAAGGYAIQALRLAPGALPGGEWAAWLRHWLDRPASALSLLAFLLFPTGRLAGPRWRPALLVPPIVVLGFTARAFVPGPLSFLGVPNPAGVDWVPRAVNDGLPGGVPLMIGTVVAAAQIATRYRAARAAEREQIKWLAVPIFALIVAILATVATFVAGIPADEGVNGAAITTLFSLAQLGLPVGMGIAIVRHRLYDIDVIINRALVYGATTGAIALAFFAAIVVLQALLRPLTGGSEVAVAVSTLAAVALAQPLRARFQRIVDRRFYRARYDSERTIDTFADRLRDVVDLDDVRSQLLAAVHATVQPRGASVWLRERP